MPLADISKPSLMSFNSDPNTTGETKAKIVNSKPVSL